MSSRVYHALLWAACLGMILCTGCPASSDRESSSDKLSVFVSIAPQAEFVKRIGGERVSVEVLVPSGQSPATYEPGLQQMATLSEAELYFRIGVPFERGLLPKVERTMPELRIIDTRRGIDLRRMHSEPHAGAHDHGHAGAHDDGHHDDHDHGHAGAHDDGHHDDPDHDHAGAHDDGHDAAHDHSHGGSDPHIWLSPRLVQVQARTIADALKQADPAGAAVYEANLQQFIADLEALDAELRQALAPVRGKTLMVFHPSWGYFADAYGLEQHAIELEGKEPSARQLTRIIARAKAEDVRVIFVQPQFSQSSAEAVAGAIDGAVVPIDPLARDYMANLRRVARTIREALGGQE